MRRLPLIALYALVALLIAVPYAAADVSTDLQITMNGSPASQVVWHYPGGSITWTIVVKNNGPLADTNVTVMDSIPDTQNYASVTTTSGDCSGGANLSCNLGTMENGDAVTITLTTTPTEPGTISNTATVAGDVAESAPADNSASASVEVIDPPRPAPSCTAVYVHPNQIYTGRSTTVSIIVENIARRRRSVRVEGVRVRITGPGLRRTTRPSDSHGRIAQVLHPSRRGVLYVRPLNASKVCHVARIGATSPTPPPVTGSARN